MGGVVVGENPPAAAPRHSGRRGAISEQDWARTVVEYAELMGWRWTHFRPAVSRNGKWATHLSGHAGFPDLVMARERVVFVELKAERGKPTEPQRDWYLALSRAGAEVYIWWPHHWDEVQRVLG